MTRGWAGSSPVGGRGGMIVGTDCRPWGVSVGNMMLT